MNKPSLGTTIAGGLLLAGLTAGVAGAFVYAGFWAVAASTGRRRYL